MLLSGLLSGCVSTPAPGVRGGDDPVAVALERAVPGIDDADRRFVRAVVDDLLINRSTGSPVHGAADAEAVRRSPTADELLFFVVLHRWPLGQQAVQDLWAVGDRVTRRIDRAVVWRAGKRQRVYLGVDGSRLPVALSLHRSGWSRVRGGEWSAPDGGATLFMPRRGPWVLTTGPNGKGGEPASSGGESASRFFVDLLDDTAVLVGERDETTRSDVTYAIAWVSGFSVPDVPAGIIPSRMTVSVRSTHGNGDDVAIDAVLPYGDERSARVATVAMRLLLPVVLERVGLESADRPEIVRDAAYVRILNITGDEETVRTLFSGVDATNVGSER